MSPAAMQDLARYLLTHRRHYPGMWTVQGFGFMRLRISERLRLHVWDSRLRKPGVSDVHDHAQWSFRSDVVSGQIVNQRYAIGPIGLRFKCANIRCGIGGGMSREPTTEVTLAPQRPESYIEAQHYEQEPDEIHRTFALDGTVTLLQQWRRDTDTARVFWQAGDWVDAEPRQATEEEIDMIGETALAVMQ